jgi:hypothetical protein
MRFRARRAHVRSTLGVLTMAITALALALPAPAAASSISAHLSAPNHSPIAGKKWYITVTISRGGRKLSGSVKYQFLVDGTVVGTQPGHSFKGGVYRDWLLFPKDAVGHPLTLRVVVKTNYGTVNLDWAVETRA